VRVRNTYILSRTDLFLNITACPCSKFTEIPLVFSSDTKINLKSLKLGAYYIFDNMKFPDSEVGNLSEIVLQLVA
jgi:hypothetical protein